MVMESDMAEMVHHRKRCIICMSPEHLLYITCTALICLLYQKHTGDVAEKTYWRCSRDVLEMFR